MGSELARLYKICTCGKASDTFDYEGHSTNTARSAQPTVTQSEHAFNYSHVHSVTSLNSQTVQMLMNMDIPHISPTLSQHNSLDKSYTEPRHATAEGVTTELSAPSTPITPQPNTAPFDNEMILDSNPRLAKMTIITDAKELKQTIEHNYKISSETTTPNRSGFDLLARPYVKGRTPRDKDIEILAKEMNQQLVSLMSERILTPYNALNRRKNRNNVHLHHEEITPSTNLLRDGSEEKWDTPRLQNECKAMKKEMFHLAAESNTFPYHSQ